MESRRVRLFRNGRNQAIRIPREFEFAGDEAILTKDGDRLIVEAPPKRGLLAALSQLSPLTDDELPIIDDLPAEPVAI
jgi:antitoxin VapB